jgi:hypothetical protein
MKQQASYKGFGRQVRDLFKVNCFHHERNKHTNIHLNYRRLPHMSKLLIHTEHLRLLHAGPLLVAASLGRHFHILGGRSTIQSITHNCAIYRQKSLRPQPPLMGQLPAKQITPDMIFNRVGVDYAGPMYVKYGLERPSITNLAEPALRAWQR